MKKLKSLLKVEKESFTGASSGFCPVAFTDEKNKKVLEIVRKYLTPKDSERTLFGEVFTPLELVCEMLSHLPDDVWTNKNLKWLDPANGIGNFPIVVYYKLMDTLKSVPENNRSRHIIENMLYMNELNPVNVAICKKIFKMIDPDSKPNLMTSNFMGEFMVTGGKDKFLFEDIKEFDVIIGNPPYNPPKTETGSSGNSIWPNFVVKSFYMLSDKGYLVFIHPPGWRKPTDETFDPVKLEIQNGDYTKTNDDGKQSIKQIRQGMVWPFLKDKGNFSFIYTNDQRSKKTQYIDHFPAVDYYVYQKGGDKMSCDTKNVFFGEIKDSKNVKIDYKLNYLPGLITSETLDILHKVTSDKGDKPTFGIYRDKPNEFFIEHNKGKHRYIYTYNNKNVPQYKYSDNLSNDDNVNMDKVIMNYDGGIDSYTIQYVNNTDKIGSFHMTMYSKVASDKEGKRIETFFNSDIVRFVFLITQYASGKMTKNEPLVANSITIPPDGVTDYYKFFDIEKHKQYVEDTLKQYDETKTKEPKQTRKKQPDKPKTDGGTKPKRKTRRKRWSLF